MDREKTNHGRPDLLRTRPDPSTAAGNGVPRPRSAHPRLCLRPRLGSTLAEPCRCTRRRSPPPLFVPRAWGSSRSARARRVDLLSHARGSSARVGRESPSSPSAGPIWPESSESVRSVRICSTTPCSSTSWIRYSSKWDLRLLQQQLKVQIM